MATYDLDSLISAAGITNVGKALGISGEKAAHYRAHGIPEDEADRLAVKLGLHPSNVWASWFRESTADILFARYALQRAAFFARSA